MRCRIMKSQPLLFIEKDWLFVNFFSTVEWRPTLSAERITFRALSPASIAWWYVLTE